MMRPALAAFLLLSGSALVPAMARDSSDDASKRALVAGYKAAFTCSATFNAGQTSREIKRNELSGIYPDYRDIMAELPGAKVDLRAKTVSVRFSAEAPPRIAVFRDGLGCAQLPVFAEMDAAEYLPSFQSWDVEVSETDDRLDLYPGITRDAVSLASYGSFDAPVDFAFDGTTYGEGTKTSAVLVVYRGEVLAERYARGINATTPQRTWSVAKSLTATIIGAAEWKGLLDIDHGVVIDAWSSGADPRNKITIRNLLQMASGLDSGAIGSRTDEVYFGGARVVDQAINASLEAEPGTRFRYANNDSLIALRSMRERMQDDGAYLRFPYENLLWKIGAYHTTLETDWNGDFIASSQVWTTARDLARIGLLYLNNGKWGDERLLPDDWLDFVTTPAPAQPDGGDFGYGAQFWLFNHDGVPSDAFAAMGHRGQYLVIIPSRDLIIVRRGYDNSGGTRFEIDRFTADIVSALNAAERSKEITEMATLLGVPKLEVDPDGSFFGGVPRESDADAQTEGAPDE